LCGISEIPSTIELSATITTASAGSASRLSYLTPETHITSVE